VGGAVSQKYSLEAVFEVWNDTTGERVQVGADRDGVDLVEIRSLASDAAFTGSVMLTDEQVPLVIDALTRYMAWKNEANRQRKNLSDGKTKT
jgi:hypothetical protein